MNARVLRCVYDDIGRCGMMAIRYVSSCSRRRSSSRSKTGLAALMLLTGICVSSAASTASKADANADVLTLWAKALPPHSTVAELEDWTLFGGRLSRIAIESQARLSVVAKTLTQARPWVNHLNVVAGEVLISGQQGGVSWLAALAAIEPKARDIDGPQGQRGSRMTDGSEAIRDPGSPDGYAYADGLRTPHAAASTRGYLSVWTPGGSPSDGLHVAPLFDALRMPPAAQLIFDIDDADSMYAAALQVWRAPAAWKDPCTDMATSMRRSGWRSERAAATTMTSWRREREVATVHCQPDGRDTLIYMHRSKDRT